jgi:16S rRNA (guanine527-N7)-methyltransferase
MNIEQTLIRGCKELNIHLIGKAYEQLITYLSLLRRWNLIYNLTAVRDPEAMVVRHLLDSLSILPWVGGPLILDIGSGAGLPGIPLAIACSGCEFFLLDSNSKRTRFLIQVVAELKLKNVNVVNRRVQDYCPSISFNSIVSRAFATLADMIVDARRLCAPDGRILAMKGIFPYSEMLCLPHEYKIVGVYPLHIPNLDAERHLVHLALSIPVS